MPQLIVNPGLPNEHVFQIGPGAATIGRTEDNAICVPHKSVSRHHARIASVDGRVTITDLESKNGTFLNGEAIKQAVLTHGDTLKCGDVVLGFTSALAHTLSIPTFV